MDADISAKISSEWGLSSETIRKYTSFYTETIRPIIKSNYLSHLVTTVENMVNDRRMRDFLNEIAGAEKENLRGLLASRTFRLYSIIIAMYDKNKFYAEECEKFVSKSDAIIFNDINNICLV